MPCGLRLDGDQLIMIDGPPYPSRHFLAVQAPYLEPGRIGPLMLRNRLVRAATGETMATVAGEATERPFSSVRTSFAAAPG